MTPHICRHPELPEKTYQKLINSSLSEFKHGKILTSKAHQEVRECKIGETTYIIKKYSYTGLLDSFRTLFKLSRADCSFKTSAYLNKKGVLTPKHWLIIKKISWFRCSAHLIMEKSDGSPFYNFIHEENRDKLPDGALNKIVDLIRNLHANRIYHGDLHVRNIMISENGQASLIDLDNAIYSRKKQHKDIKRLLRSVNHRPRMKKELSRALEKHDG